jgi:hypothetical protein
VTNSGLYEDLYFGNLQAIGCIRHRSFDIAQNTHGQIYLTSSSSTGMDKNEAYAAANATKRVFLDLYLKNCYLDSVIVPRSSFDAVVQGVYQNGFSDPALQTGSNTVTRVIWLIVSDPPGQSQYVVH